MKDWDDMIADDLAGGFEKIRKQPGKVGRQDSKRISKDERKRVKKQRKTERKYEREKEFLQTW